MWTNSESDSDRLKKEDYVIENRASFENWSSLNISSFDKHNADRRNCIDFYLRSSHVEFIYYDPQGIRYGLICDMTRPPHIFRELLAQTLKKLIQMKYDTFLKKADDIF